MPATASTSINHWPDSACARAFWGQQDIPPYRRLLADTIAWLDPKPGEEWLDLGCGCGQLTGGLWEKAQGSLGRVVASDCAAINEQAIAKLRSHLRPSPAEEQLSFVHLDFSNGLPVWDDATFDGVVSGLAIQYAEYYCQDRGCWTTDAYDRLLCEVHRVLRVGGRFVFSVNVPEPGWRRVALQSLHGIFRARHPGRYFKNSMRMMRYGKWLTREARRGRFHYLPIETIVEKLRTAGFSNISHRLTYAGQAYLVRCLKPI
ncbi:MAG TPA: methyltransferase domain-containing protein [Gemmataceae bacterium]|jgi:ubiquinone/menaquinone biosynthesis C-methylase UbiE|nr:methyltransferase domain-containing protein [Gemmataceae bacterium]